MILQEKSSTKSIRCLKESDVFDKIVSAPTSKSYANRILILAAIAKSEVRIRDFPNSTDVLTLITCFKVIGLSVEQLDQDLVIKNSFPDCESLTTSETIILNTGDGGTTNRFLIALLALGKKKYVIVPTLAMSSRPMEDLFNPLLKNDVIIDWLDSGWAIQGPITRPKEILVNCHKSTQFASALKMILPTCKIITKGLVSSKRYYEMTEYLIKQFTTGLDCISIPLDASSLGYPMALGATLGSCLIKNFKKEDPFQADSVLCEILKEMGCTITIDHRGMLIKKSKLKAIKWDCTLCPDLVPTLVYLCSYSDGISILSNLEILRHKESDRINEIFKLLIQFKIPYNWNEDDHSLKIIGVPNQKLGVMKCCPAADHRMIMVSCLYLLKNSGGSVTNSDHIKKSYPDFIEDFI